jgi:hypothetical protein
MDRRDFLKLAGAAATAGPLAGQQTQMPAPMPGPMTPAASVSKEISGTVVNLEIAPVTVELAPNRIVSTIGYNGMSPGPLLRMKERAPVTVNLVNKTDTPEYVHFHGLLIPADVDGPKRKVRRRRRVRGCRGLTRGSGSGRLFRRRHGRAGRRMHGGLRVRLPEQVLLRHLDFFSHRLPQAYANRYAAEKQQRRQAAHCRQERQRPPLCCVLARGAALRLRKAYLPVLNRQKTTQSMVRISDAIIAQSGAETWLPVAIGVVMIVADVTGSFPCPSLAL